MSEERERGEVLFGVSLQDLAYVHAAERAGVAAEERVDELGLDRTAFSRAEQAWSERLARSLRDEPSLVVEYDMALAAALVSDAPKILPLEEELGAWVSFEGHFQRAADPAELAQRVGLTLLEVARLHRAWAERLAASPELAQEAANKRAEEPLPLPEIRREPRRRPAVRPAVRAPAPSTAKVKTSEFAARAAPAPAVPFSGRAPAEEAISRAKEHAEKAQPAVSTDVARIGDTAPVNVGAIARKVLAFDAPTPTAPAPLAPLPVAPSPVAPPLVAPPLVAPPPAPLSSETAPVDIGAIARKVLAFEPAKPAAPNPNEPLPGLPFSLEEIAAIAAELSLHPDRSAAIWSRVGVRDGRAAAAIMAQVNARLHADAAFRQAWQSAYDAHRARLAGARR